MQTAKAFGSLSLQLSQEAQKGSKDAISPVAKNQARLNFVKKGVSSSHHLSQHHDLMLDSDDSREESFQPFIVMPARSAVQCVQQVRRPSRQPSLQPSHLCRGRHRARQPPRPPRTRGSGASSTRRLRPRTWWWPRRKSPRSSSGCGRRGTAPSAAGRSACCS